MFEIAIFLAKGAVYLYIVAAILGIIAISKLDREEKFACAYILGMAAISLVQLFTASRNTNTLYLVHIGTLLTFTTLPFAFIRKYNSPKIVKIVVVSVVFLTLLAIWEALIAEDGLIKYNSITTGATGILLGVLALRRLIALKNDVMVYSLPSESMFWVSLGTAIYFLGAVVIIIFTDLVQQTSNDSLITITFIRLLVLWISIIAFIFAFLLIIRSRRKESRLMEV